MEKEEVLSVCNHLATSIDNNYETGIRAYSSLLLDGLFRDFEDYEEARRRLDTSSGEELLSQARSLYSTVAMEVLMISAGLGCLI